MVGGRGGRGGGHETCETCLELSFETMSACRCLAADGPAPAAGAEVARVLEPPP